MHGSVHGFILCIKAQQIHPHHFLYMASNNLNTIVLAKKYKSLDVICKKKTKQKTMTAVPQVCFSLPLAICSPLSSHQGPGEPAVIPGA